MAEAAKTTPSSSATAKTGASEITEGFRTTNSRVSAVLCDIHISDGCLAAAEHYFLKGYNK